MKLIAFSTLLAAVLLTGTAFAGVPGLPGLKYKAVDATTPSAVRTEQTKQQTGLRLPPVKLPNVTALTRALLKEPDHSKLASQRVSSARVLKFWEERGKWLRAPNKEKCWEVPWQRSCTVARASWRLHTALYAVADHRLKHELPGANDWSTAIRIAQRPFPGTASFLDSCSGAEGGHGRFVLYQGRPYYPGAEYARTFHGWMVGGWMQYMWPTFKGHYRHALESLRERGFSVRLPAPDDVGAWQSPLAQALAAGWARWSGNDDSHWSASHGDGC